MTSGELVEWRVKSFKEKWSREKRLHILSTIQKLCEYHSVGTLSVKKIDSLRSSPGLDRLMRNLIRQCKRHGIKVQQYSLSDLDYDLRTGKPQNKGQLVDQVVERHPKVKHEYLRERNNRAEYYTKMFEAIAMAEQVRDI